MSLLNLFTITWPAGCTDLPPGEYELHVTLKDVYEEMHDLMRNYADEQTYTIAFTL